MSDGTPEAVGILQGISASWHYFLGGLLSLFGIAAVIKKGKNQQVAIIPLSERHIDNKMQICALELEQRIQEKHEKRVKEEIEDMKQDMLREIELMIKAAIK